ncbi:phage tail protein [Escherichia coli]|uniref:phage tail protein n=1 Tax=Escherichia coli TaxID=562 RepID=UPI003F4981E1
MPRTAVSVRRHWRWLGMEVTSQPSVMEVRFGDGYSQRAPAGLNADLKIYNVSLSVSRDDARRLEDTYRQIKVTCAKWTTRINMLRVEFSAEFKQVVS